MVSRFVRVVRTASGAVAVQRVTRQGRQWLGIEHVGSAHTDEELALLLAAATARLMPGQAALDVGAVPVVMPLGETRQGCSSIFITLVAGSA